MLVPLPVGVSVRSFVCSFDCLLVSLFLFARLLLFISVCSCVVCFRLVCLSVCVFARSLIRPFPRSPDSSLFQVTGIDGNYRLTWTA